MSDIIKDFPMEYSWPLRISTYDADKNRNIRLSSILELQQESGDLQFRGAGLPYEVLFESGIVFVTSRLTVRMKQRPRLGENVKLTTWHRDNKRVQFYRCYTFEDQSGHPLIESITSFVIIDPVTHRPLRPKVFEQFGIPHQPGRTVSLPDPSKLSLPDGMAYTATRHILYSDIDYNGHLNNTVYADFLCDYMPEQAKNKEIAQFSISFIAEALENDDIQIFTALENDTVWYQGKTDRGICFEAQVLLR